MLTDEEILLLRKDKEYAKLNGIGWKWLIASCVNEDFEVKPDVSAAKSGLFVAKRLIVVKELTKCRQQLIEQFIDCNDEIPRTPHGNKTNL
ncbi:MAG: hypothetical protein IPG22_20005 [Acidobacteria bacterium]|nr:hypothetical protein [Acidobacteriota bacterium]